MIEPFEIFCRKITCLTLIRLLSFRKKEINGTKLIKEVGCTYSHGMRLINEFEDLGLINSRTIGRQKLLKITKKGREIGAGLIKIREELRKDGK